MKNVPARSSWSVEALPIFVAPAPALVLPIPLRVIVPWWSVASWLISSVPIALLAPIAPPTEIAPPSASSVKVAAVPLASSLIVELKVISPSCVPVLLAVTSISTLSVKITGPVMVTSLLAPLVVEIFAPKEMEVSAVNETDLTLDIAPPILIVLFSDPPEPSVMVTVSVTAPPVIVPVIVIGLPVLSKEKLPPVVML